MFATVVGATGLTIAAHRFGSGEWLLVAHDGADLTVLKDEVAERLVLALRDLPSSP